MNSRQKLVQKQFLNNEQAVIKRLNQVYGEALSELNEKIENLDFTIDKLQEEYDWMEPDDPKKAQVKSKIQSKIYQKQYQKQLQKQVDGVLNYMQTKQFVTISEYLDTCYTDGFIGTVFDAFGQGVPFVTPIDQKAMVRAVQLESKISKGLYTKLGEDVNLLKRKITAEISRGIVTGMTYSQVAKSLSNQSKIGYNKAIRIARTEGHRIQTTATMDAMKAAKEKGANVVKQWDSTLDRRTRDSHVGVDGEVRELDKPFSNGLMFPGDPSGKPSEVINCRCALLQKARSELNDGFTKWNNFTKQLETFDSPTDYNEFKKTFFSTENQQYMKYVEDMESKYGTKNFKVVLGSMSDKEYKHYKQLLDGNPLYRKKKIDESVFSTFNMTMADSVRPKSIMNEMRKSEIGKETLDYLIRENIPVGLYYGIDYPKGTSGMYDPIANAIYIYCDETKTIKETTLAVIHEGTHAKLAGKGDFDEEVECYKAERLHLNGYLTDSDIDDIISLVKRNYPHLL